MKILNIVPFLILITIISFSCSQKDEMDEVDILEPIGRFEYSQEEKDAELVWIEQYVSEMEINANKTDSGLYYQIIKEGSGIVPDSTDTVIAHFEAYNARTGDTLGISNREENPYGQILLMNQLVEGVREGFLLSREGTTIRMIVPSFLAFGKIGDPVFGVDPETIFDYIFELNIVLKD